VAEAVAASPRIRVGAVTVAVAGVALFALQFPLFMARMTELPGDPAERQLVEPDPLTERGFTRLIDSRVAAQRWSDDPTVAKSLGFAYLAMAQRNEDAESGAEDDRIRAAVAELQRGLAEAPGDAPAWVQLSLAHAMLGDDDSAIRALRMSVTTGTNFATLSPIRGQLGLMYWFDLDDATRLGIAADFRRLVRQLPREFADVARRLGLSDLVLLALKDDPDLLERFQRAQFM
jgi:hypothetical protein